MTVSEIDRFARLAVATWQDKVGDTWFTGEASSIVRLAKIDPDDPRVDEFFANLAATLSLQDTDRLVLAAGKQFWDDLSIVVLHMRRYLPGGVDHQGLSRVRIALQDVIPSRSGGLDPASRMRATICLSYMGGDVRIAVVEAMDADTLLQTDDWYFAQTMHVCTDPTTAKAAFMSGLQDRLPGTFDGDRGRRILGMCVNGIPDPD